MCKSGVSLKGRSPKRKAATINNFLASDASSLKLPGLKNTMEGLESACSAGDIEGMLSNTKRLDDVLNSAAATTTDDGQNSMCTVLVSGFLNLYVKKKKK